MASLRILLRQVMRKSLMLGLVLLFGISVLTARVYAATPGDVCGSATVDISDALCTLRYIVGLIPHNTSNDAIYLTADVSPLDTVTLRPKGNMQVDIADALGILRRVVNLDKWIYVATPLPALTAAPLHQQTITGFGFDPAAALTVSFFDNNGFKSDVPVLEADSTSITVAVPPYSNPATGMFGPGTVNVQVIQNSGGSIAASNTNTGFQIGSLPALTLPPGSVTANVAGFLELALTDTENRLSELDSSSGGQINTVALRAQLENIRLQYGQLKSKIRNAIANPGLAETVGEINGVPISLDQESLRIADQLMVAAIDGILAEIQGAPLQQQVSVAQDSGFLALAQVTGCSHPDDPVYCQVEKSLMGSETIDGSEGQAGLEYGQAVVPAAREKFATIMKWFGAAAATTGAVVIISGASIPIGAVAAVTAVTVTGMVAVFGMDAATLSVNHNDKAAAKRLLDDFNGTLGYMRDAVLSPTSGAISKETGIMYDLLVGWMPIVEDKIPVFLTQAKTYIDAILPPTCTFYSYSGWTSCQPNNTQTRTVVFSSPAGCEGTPVLSQACTYIPPIPGNTFKGPFSGTTTEISPTATIKYDVSAIVTISVSGGGTLIDPYNGTMKIDGTIAYNAVANFPYVGGDSGSEAINLEGTVYGSQFKVEGSAAEIEKFTGGTIDGNTLTGTLSFDVGCYYACADPIVKTITLTK